MYHSPVTTVAAVPAAGTGLSVVSWILSSGTGAVILLVWSTGEAVAAVSTGAGVLSELSTVCLCEEEMMELFFLNQEDLAQCLIARQDEDEQTYDVHQHLLHIYK